MLDSLHVAVLMFSTAVGVDLGTTFSVVGVNINGKVVIIEDKEGHKIFPSIVSYQDDGPHTGYGALPFLSSHPTKTIFNAKRFIGKRFDTDELTLGVGIKLNILDCSIDDEDVSAYAAAHPFKVVENSGSEFGKVAFQARQDLIVTPEQVGAQVIQ